jgi:prepilin-type N-terminal cleavage/methylation domain-containing protein
VGGCIIKTAEAKGFSLIELLTTVAVSSIVFLITMSVLYRLYQEKAQAEFMLALTELRITFQNAVIKSQSWSRTQSNNSSMSCFSGGAPSSCLALNGVAAQDLKLYSGETLLYDGSDATAGFTRSGAPCSTFGAGSDCILKPNLKWFVQCNLAVDPSCLSPLVVIDLKYNYKGQNAQTINFDSYGFRIAKSTFSLQVTKPCGGVVPACSASQAALCESGSWVCREFSP